MELVRENMKGKRVPVTGASSGLGAHFAELLLDNGAEVLIAARRVTALEALRDRLSAKDQHRCLAVDVTDASSRTALAEAAGPIDVLINNAGLARESPAQSHPTADWEAVLDTNLKGMFFLA